MRNPLFLASMLLMVSACAGEEERICRVTAVCGETRTITYSVCGMQASEDWMDACAVHGRDLCITEPTCFCESSGETCDDPGEVKEVSRNFGPDT